MNYLPQMQQFGLQNLQQPDSQMLWISLPLAHYVQIYGKLLVDLLWKKKTHTVRSYSVSP
jgi:hypothetical protein